MVQEAAEMMLSSAVSLVVDVVDDRGEVVARGSGDDDLLGAGVDVSLGLGLGGVEAGALEDDVDVELAPGQVGGVGLLVDLDLLAVDDDGILSGGDLVIAAVVALRGVVLPWSRTSGGTRACPGR